jgi:hypothetical protein
MKINARFERKENAVDVNEAQIDKIIELSGEVFDSFSRSMLRDYDFIAEFGRNMYVGSDGVTHCMLVLGEGNPDGILINSEGGAYGRYTAYLPNARIFVDSEIKKIADEIIREGTADSEKGAWTEYFDEAADRYNISLEKGNGIVERLETELDSRTEVKECVVFDDGFEMLFYPEHCPNCSNHLNQGKMKTELTMRMPEELDTREVEITGVIVLPDNEYKTMLADGSLPEYYMDRLNKYTEAVTQAGSCAISGYKALLVLNDDSDNGAAVCGRNYVSYAAEFPGAKEWLDRRICEMADYISCESEEVSFDELQNRFGTVITSDNGTGELMLRELEKRGAADFIITDGQENEHDSSPVMDM